MTAKLIPVADWSAARHNPPKSQITLRRWCRDGKISGGIPANAEALLLLEEHRRFRVKKDYGRMVCGYWQENDPNKEPR